MELTTALREEHSRAQTERIVNWIGGRVDRMAKLVELVCHGEPLLQQRGAWALGHAGRRWPSLMEPHMGEMLDVCETPGVHAAVRRNIFRILEEAPIPPQHEERLLQAAFGAVGLDGEPVAIKAYCLTILNRLTAGNPELQREIKLLVEERIPLESDAFASRAKREFGIGEKGSPKDARFE